MQAKRIDLPTLRMIQREEGPAFTPTAELREAIVDQTMAALAEKRWAALTILRGMMPTDIFDSVVALTSILTHVPMESFNAYLDSKLPGLWVELREANVPDETRELIWSKLVEVAPQAAAQRVDP